MPQLRLLIVGSIKLLCLHPLFFLQDKNTFSLICSYIIYKFIGATRIKAQTEKAAQPQSQTVFEMVAVVLLCDALHTMNYHA